MFGKWITRCGVEAEIFKRDEKHQVWIGNINFPDGMVKESAWKDNGNNVGFHSNYDLMEFIRNESNYQYALDLYLANKK